VCRAARQKWQQAIVFLPKKTIFLKTILQITPVREWAD
jgi:hypothetical protein